MIQAGRPDDAESALRQALTEHPESIVLRNSLATILRQKGEFSEAIQLLRETVALAPDHLELSNNLAILLMTATEDQDRRTYEAIEIMERVCQATKYEDPHFLRTLCVLLAKANRFDEGMAYAQRGRSLADAQGDLPLTGLFDELVQGFRQAKELGVDPFARPPELSPTTKPVPASGPAAGDG
jgi:predicted Zn-dependent protease